MAILDMDNFAIQFISHEKNYHTATHAHRDGQIFMLDSGMISCTSKNYHWSITPNSLGWIPPMIEHSSISWGKIKAKSFHLPATIAKDLPSQPCVLQTNSLIKALIDRIVTFTHFNQLTDQQKTIIQVLIDEIKDTKPVNSLLLPYPTNPGLVKITQAIWQNPSSTKSQSQWAIWAGISVRSLSRYFMQETGMTFAHWKQLAKLLASLPRLSEQKSITEVAYLVGFSDASAYIAAFRSVFGVSPKRYLNKKFG